MKVNGDTMPDALRVESNPQHDNLLTVRLTENAKQTADGWEYDEYVMEVPNYPNLAADIAANFDNWIEQAKAQEQADKPVEQQFDEVRTESADNKLVASITFVVLAEQGTIDDVTAGEHAELFAEWAWPVAYATGNLRRDPVDENLYRCITAHTSQEDWPPRLTPALWAKTSDPADEWPEWSQPISAEDAYMLGDKVSHNDKHWVSDYDNNVWEPGVFGWHEEAV